VVCCSFGQGGWDVGERLGRGEGEQWEDEEQRQEAQRERAESPLGASESYSRTLE